MANTLPRTGLNKFTFFFARLHPCKDFTKMLPCPSVGK